MHDSSWLALDNLNAGDQGPYLILSLFRTHCALLSPQPSRSPFFIPSDLCIISPSSAHTQAGRGDAVLNGEVVRESGQRLQPQRKNRRRK